MTHTDLLAAIDRYCAATGLSPSYLGRLAVGNSKLHARLLAKRRITTRTAEKLLEFIKADLKARKRRPELRSRRGRPPFVSPSQDATTSTAERAA